MATTISDLSTIVKEVYDPFIREILPTAHPLYDKIIGKVSREDADKYSAFVKLATHWGGGARSENEALPSSNPGSYVKGYFRKAYNYWTMEFSGPAMETAIQVNKLDTPEGIAALKNIVDGDIQDAIKQFKWNLARQIYGDGGGELTQVNGAHTSGDTTIVVDDLRYLKRKMIIDFDTTSTGHTIVALDRTNKIITISPGLSANVADNTSIYLNGSKDKEMIGLGSIFASGTYLNIDPTVSGQEDWVAHTYDNSGTPRDLTSKLVTEIVMELVNDWSANPQTLMLLMSLTQYLQLVDQLKSERTFQVSDLQLKGGFTGVELTVEKSKIEIIHDPLYPEDDTAMLIDYSTLFGKYSGKDKIFWDETGDKTQGGMIFKRKYGYDVYEAVLKS